MNFKELIHLIKETDMALKQRAMVAINITVTFRNWLTGFYIVEFEQNGEDRAKYGESLLQRISDELTKVGKKGYSSRNLRLFRQFYFVYPQIWQSLIAKFPNIEFQINTKGQSLIAKFKTDNFVLSKTSKEENYGVEIDTLINRLSYTHLVELISINDSLKRAFYEIECIKGNWSVRELQRQIGSLLFERIGLSSNKEKVIEIANDKADLLLPTDIIKDPYVFEFLGLKQTDVLDESSLEDLLIQHLQEFILELGKGFCFESRQKRITIGNKHYYIDLVFYHKVLKCNVIIELKNRDFEHSDISQLNVYLSYYRKNEWIAGDNPPIGILLCTGKNEELVEYATDGWDKNLFVSQFQLSLPTKDELKEFIHRQKNLF